MENKERKESLGRKKEKACSWSATGAVSRATCESRPDDCSGCPIDNALEKVNPQKQRAFFTHDYFDYCSVHACALGEKPCPFVGPCIGNWSRTPSSAARVLTLLGIGMLSPGVNASFIQQTSRRRGLHADLVSLMAELRASGQLKAGEKLKPSHLGLDSVEKQFAMIAAASFLDCLDSLDLKAFANSFFEPLATTGLLESVRDDLGAGQLWDNFRAYQALAILDVISAWDVQTVRELQEEIASQNYSSLNLTHMALSVQRALQTYSKVPPKLDPSVRERVVATVAFAEGLLGKTFANAFVAFEIAAAIIIGKTMNYLAEESSKNAGRVLAKEIFRLLQTNHPDLRQIQPLLAGVLASGYTMSEAERSALTAFLSKSFREKFQKLSDMRADPESLLVHLAVDNLIHEPHRFASMTSAEAVVEEAATELDPELLGCALPQERLYSAGHTWIKATENGTVRIGLDDMVTRLAGSVDQIVAASSSTQIKRGKVVLRLVRGNESVGIASPVNGKLVAVNRSVLDLPALLGKDPYGDGWLFEVKPEEPEKFLPQLMAGDRARRWLKDEVSKLREMFRSSAFATAADGANLAYDALSGLEGVSWSGVLKKFLKV